MSTTEAESYWKVRQKVCEALEVFCPPLSQDKIIYYFIITVYMSVVVSNVSDKKVCKYNSYSTVTVDYYYCLVTGCLTYNTQCI